MVEIRHLLLRGSELPDGLSISSTGLITGTPTVSGTFTSTVAVTYPYAEPATLIINWTIGKNPKSL